MAMPFVGFSQHVCKPMSEMQVKRITELQKELASAFKNIVELKDGYEVYFSDAYYSKATEWVSLESQCCPSGKYQVTVEPKSKLTKLVLANIDKEEIVESWGGMKEWLERNKK